MGRRTRSSISNEEELSGKALKVARHIVFLDAVKSYLNTVRQSPSNNLPDVPDFEAIVAGVTSVFDLPDHFQKEFTVKVSSKTPITKKQIDFIFELLDNELPNRPEYKLFKRAVDPDRDGAPDYYQVISTPMCFETIKQKVTEKLYENADALKADFDLIFDNAMKYTPNPTHDVHRAAKRMKHFIDQLWSKLPDSEKVVQDPSVKPIATPKVVRISRKIQTIKETDPAFLKAVSDIVYHDLKLEDRPKRLVLTAFDDTILDKLEKLCDDTLESRSFREGSPDTFGTASRTIGEDVNI